MKHILILGLLLLPGVTFAAFDTNLKYGSKGEAVLELQEFLTDQGVYSGPITGNFFSLTRSAVKRFQELHSIAPAAGYFGPITRTKANELLNVASETEQEVLETGTTTPPVITPIVTAPPAPPSPPAPTAPEPTPTPDPATPTRLSVQGTSEVTGANCQPATFRVSVIDQYGAEMPGQSVTMTAPYAETTNQSVSERSGDAVRSYAIFHYLTRATSTIESIGFTSGSLSASTKLSVSDGLEAFRNDLARVRAEGFRVDEQSLLCI